MDKLILLGNLSDRFSMDPINYYLTTITQAFKNIAPILAFLVGGYFIFVKLPFLFLRKNMADQKKKMEDESPALPKEDRYTVEHYKEFQRTLKLMNGHQEEKKQETKQEKKQETKQERKQEQKQESRQESRQEKKQEPKKEAPRSTTRSPEEIFNIKPGEKLSSGELKKRYFELLKQNHPDRVASMGNDFKTLAEKNTKDINKAFEILKKKAS